MSQLEQNVSEEDKDTWTDIVIEDIKYYLTRCSEHDTATQITEFCSGSLPVISIGEYVDRISRYSDMSLEALCYSLVYMILYCHNTQSILTQTNVHRLFLVGCVVASKYIDDRSLKNKYMATIGGIPTPELNELEIIFLQDIEFDLSVSAFQYAYILALIHQRRL
jgi:Cyclin.